MKQTKVQRHTSEHPCPICGGHASAPRDNGNRCHGFVSQPGRVAHCSRIESDREDANGTWRHRLDRECSCGSDHRVASPAPLRGKLGHPSTWAEKADAVYDYRDEQGELLFQVLRFGHGPGKTFRQRRPDPNEGWVGNLDGVRRVPYRLPELIEAKKRSEEIFVVEGEKDADRLNDFFQKRQLPCFATCNPQGAKNWAREYAAFFEGAPKITVWRDRDKDGHLWGARVLADLAPFTSQFRLVESYSGKDAADQLDEGLGIEHLVDVTPERTPADHRVPVWVLSEEEFVSDEVPEEIVEGLVYRRSVTMLNGASKAGKSILATQMAMCVANGEPFLGLAVQQSKVLFISLEMSAALVRERMGAIARDVEIGEPRLNESFHLAAPTQGASPGLNLSDAADVEHLYRLIDETGAEVVVVDTLYRFIPGLDLSDNSAMGEVMDTLLRVANDTGAAVFVLHHVRKGDGTGVVSQSGLGAQILGGAANVVVELNRRPEGWEVSTASHYGSWDTPLTYRRPQIGDGELGMGCVPCTATEAEAVGRDQIVGLFTDRGERWDEIQDEGFRDRIEAGLAHHGFTTIGALVFPSQNSLVESMVRSGLRASEGPARRLVQSLMADFGSAGLLRVDGPGRAMHYVLVSGGESLLQGAATAERPAPL